MCALGTTPKAIWLEPAHGTGVFVEAIARSGVASERIVAIDIDPKTSPADRLATTLRDVDFLHSATAKSAQDPRRRAPRVPW